MKDNKKTKTPKTKGKLWQGASTTLNSAIERFTVGDDPVVDMELFPFDLRASAAHARGLKRIGILTAKEVRTIEKGLSELQLLWQSGKVTIRQEDEDCHTVIEGFLTDRYGDVGRKIHTGRSRNDQVLVATRLFMRDTLREISLEAKKLGALFLTKAAKFQNIPMPGYSHTQQAMLSTVGHYLASFAESFADDSDFAEDVVSHIDSSPLGSAAGFGVALPLDRVGVAKDLGFAAVQVNSLYCQSSRGKFEGAFLHALVQIMLTLGRFANDGIWMSSREFKFFSVDASLLTGSSIMPHKRNYDGLEILRGHVNTVISHEQFVINLSRGLLSGYNRDLQLIKKPLFESARIVRSSLEIATLFLNHLNPDEARLREVVAGDIFLVDEANRLVKTQGIPFRVAYQQVKGMGPLPKEDLDQNVKSKKSLGAPGNLALSLIGKRL